MADKKPVFAVDLNVEATKDRRRRTVSVINEKYEVPVQQQNNYVELAADEEWYPNLGVAALVIQTSSPVVFVGQREDLSQILLTVNRLLVIDEILTHFRLMNEQAGTTAKVYINIAGYKSGTGPVPVANVTSLNGLINDVLIEAGDNITVVKDIANNKLIINATGAGGVAEVGLSAPVQVFQVTGSPLTESGTLGLEFVTQNAATVFAGPEFGSPSAKPTFRFLKLTDISDLQDLEVDGGVY